MTAAWNPPLTAATVDNMSNSLVLVTGGSGFLGAHTVAQLLQRGYQVRTTVRSLSREAGVREMITAAGVDAGDRLSIVAADLTSDDGWTAAAAGAEYVLHLASPFPTAAPNDENELIVPAREGALRVLRAARDAAVRRVVLTSSFAAIGYGHPGSGPFDETVWTNTKAPIPAYIKSKTLAERAAWQFIENQGGPLELAVINPTGIFGPALGADYAGSLTLVKALIDGQFPFLPDLRFGIADVRDVADLHLRAMVDPAASGQRFIASGGFSSLADMANILRTRLGAEAAKVPSRQIPTTLLKFLARVRPPLREMARDAGQIRQPALGKATRVLDWTPRPIADTVVDTARSLLRVGATDQTTVEHR
jgi:nucleoside-diphosphate-sugar epimerase